MFTGIVQAKLALKSLVRHSDFASFHFEFPDSLRQGLQLGASVAINGTCLTVRSIEGKQVSFDAIAQTLKVTNLGALKPGSIVNIERAARIGDEIGGHFLSGHIMRTVKVLEVTDSAFNRVLWFERPQELAAFILDKGFIALNGCSLTIAELAEERFAVYLIPETRDVTTFGQVQVGDDINLEVDAQTQAVVETVRRVLASGAVR